MSRTTSETSTPKKVRPAEIGEFLRKYVSRRLLALSEGEIAALTTSIRQIRVGTSGSAEALAIFNQLLYDEWMAGSLRKPLARIKVNEKNCFGMIEWKAAPRFLPKHTSAAAWNHRNVSFVEQEGFSPMPQDRGAEQGDVDEQLKCSLAFGMVAAETRGSIAARQAAGTLPCIGVNDPSEEQRLQADHAARLQESGNFQLGSPEKLTGAHDPRDAKAVAWRINGTWTMVTACATQSWCCPHCRTSTLPMPESELKTHRKQKSSTT